MQPVRKSSLERPALANPLKVQVLPWAHTGGEARWVGKGPRVHLLPVGTVAVTRL